jgi:hypothetical protein
VIVQSTPELLTTSKVFVFTSTVPSRPRGDHAFSFALDGSETVQQMKHPEDSMAKKSNPAAVSEFVKLAGTALEALAPWVV